MPADEGRESAGDRLADRRVVLLGPQRQPTVDRVVDEVDGDLPLATVTAGWQEREPDDAELDALLDGRSANLHLYGRWLDIQERDPDFAKAELAQCALLDELRTLHLVHLESAIAALHTLTQRNGDRPAAIESVVSDAEAVVRLIDERHAERVSQAHHEFESAFPTEDREAIAEHRELVAKLLEQSGALFLAGGHVGVLLRLLSLFRVADAVPELVVAWSAGAMALTDQVVLFHDRTPQGRSPDEVFDRGMGVLHSVVLLPDARRRLSTDDPVRMSQLARRFSPAHCLVLDRDDRLDLDPALGAALPAGARVVGADGRIGTGRDR